MSQECISMSYDQSHIVINKIIIQAFRQSDLQPLSS